MCVSAIQAIEVTTVECTVWKVVRLTALPDTFQSQFDPINRNCQDSLHYSDGVVVLYTLDVPVESSFETTPGLYCFADEREAQQYARPQDRVMRCTVPVGTRVRKAVLPDWKYDVLLVERLIPIDVNETHSNF